MMLTMTMRMSMTAIQDENIARIAKAASHKQGLTGSRYPTRPELFFKYPTRPDPKIENDWVPGN